MCVPLRLYVFLRLFVWLFVFMFIYLFHPIQVHLCFYLIFFFFYLDAHLFAYEREQERLWIWIGRMMDLRIFGGVLIIITTHCLKKLFSIKSLKK